MPIPNCRSLFRHDARQALDFAAASAGNNNAAKMAMIAITTNSSINVKARTPDPALREGDFPQ
jgi:hypothetical protein